MSCPTLHPLGWSASRHPAHRAADHDRTSRASARATVLVVDDDQRVRRLTARMLRDAGYATFEAASAAEALELLVRERDVQVVVSDIVMPGGDGVQLAEQIRAHHPHCHVVLVTGYAPELLVNLGIRRLRFPVLLKPFGAGDLARRVKDALEGRH